MKTNEELLKEFLANGGKIQKIPTEPYEYKAKVGSTVKKVPELKTLAQGELLYGKKKKVTKKVKTPDYSDIDMELIPDYIKKLINYDATQESEKTKE